MDCLEFEDGGDVRSLTGSPDDDEVDDEEAGDDKPTDEKGRRGKAASENKSEAMSRGGARAKARSEAQEGPAAIPRVHALL